MKKVFSFAVLALVLLTGCSEEKKATSEAVESAKKSASSTMDKIEKEVTPVVESVKKEASDAMESVEKAAAPVVEEAQKSLTAAKEMANESAKEVTQEVEKSVEEAKQLVASEDESTKGAQLYVKCIACHGKNAEKKALGTSQIIKGWDKDKLVQALKGYKNSTYGGAMKTVMVGQMASMSDEEIEILAEYISNF